MDRIKNILREIKYRHLDNEIVDTQKAISEFHFIAKLNNKYGLLDNSCLLRDYCKLNPFTYYPTEFLFDDLSKKINGNNILFGNSSFTANNHIEMIDILAGIDLGERKVVTPLSYGSKEYASIVKKYGREKLGDNFYPLTEFLSLEKYNELVRQCGFVIINHYRPQGVGNILASLYLGSKIFQNDTSFYRYLKDLGCYVFTIEELLSDNEKAFELLSSAEIEHNRKRLRDEISTESIINKMRIAFNENFDF